MDTVHPDQDVKLECFELVQPFRTFDLDATVLLTADTVNSAEEAWHLFKGDNSHRLFILNGVPLVDLNRCHNWSGNAVDESGRSVLTSLSLAAGAPVGYGALAASLGVKSDQTFFDQKEGHHRCWVWTCISGGKF